MQYYRSSNANVTRLADDGGITDINDNDCNYNNDNDTANYNDNCDSDHNYI